MKSLFKIIVFSIIKKLIELIIFSIASGVIGIIGNAIGKAIMRVAHGVGNIPNVAFTIAFLYTLGIGLIVGFLWIIIGRPLFFEIMENRSPETIKIVMICFVACYVAVLLFIGGIPMFI